MEDREDDSHVLAEWLCVNFYVTINYHKFSGLQNPFTIILCISAGSPA